MPMYNTKDLLSAFQVMSLLDAARLRCRLRCH